MRYHDTRATLSNRHVGAVAALAAATLVGPSAVARAQQSRPAFPPGIIVQIDSLARAQLALDGVGGMTIGIVTDAGIAWTNSYGYTDIARHTPASRETVYRIGSITKQFTAIMLRQLASRHVVRTSDAADRYLPALDSVPDAGSRASHHAPPTRDDDVRSGAGAGR
jgi:CubicO group peptidase (beta-lactamase class C family)